MGLRPYQQEALSKIKEKYDAGHTRLLTAMATGTGKTVLFSHLPKLFPAKKGIVIVHRKELAQQAKDKIAHWNPDLSVGVEMGDQWADASHDIIVGSVQTLGNTGSTRIQKYNPADFGWVCVDEAHHATSDSYKPIFDHFGVNQPGSRRLLLGVTATPYRGDGADLSNVFETMAYQLSIYDAVKQGWLSDLRGIKVTTATNLDKVHTRAGDFAQNELETAVNTTARNRAIVEAWLERAENRQTVAFCVDIAHSKALAAEYQAHGVRAEAVWGVDPDREEKIAAHKAGKITVLTNANVLTEGYDDWRIRCVMMAKPTKSQLAYVQMAGRGTRLQENVDNLLDAKKSGLKLEKEDCILMDVVDNTSKHSLVTLPKVFGMNEKMDLRGKSVVVTKDIIDAKQAEYPAADLGKLEDIDQLEKKIESVDLWTVKYPDEVLKESNLQWHKTPDGAYVLYISPKDGVRVWSDLLNKWTVFLHIGDTTMHEENFESRKEAFKFAERMVNLCGSKHISYLRREWKSGDEPATEPQLRYLRKLRVPFSPTITKGEASRMLTQINAKAFSITPVGVKE